MVRAPTKTCPNLHKILSEAPADLISSFLAAPAFQRMDWLDRYRFDPSDMSGPHEAGAMLAVELKSTLSPLEKEAARIIEIASPRGQLAIEGLVREVSDEALRAEFRKNQDELTRSLWSYLKQSRLFEAAENALHLRLYRRYDRHYQTFQASPVATDALGLDSKFLKAFIKDLEARLDRGKGCFVDRFDIPEEADEPAAEMFLIHHPNLPSSVREIDEQGAVSKFYFRPPGEAMVVYVPTTGRVHVRADTRAIRHLVRECFVTKVLEQDLSHQPTDFQAYDISRFLHDFELPAPDDKEVLVKDVSVVRLEVSVGNLANRLSVSTTIGQSVKDLIDSLPGVAETFSRSIAVRFVEIAVRYRRADRTSDETLDFTISDQNTCSLLSVNDPFERLLGHRLLRAWHLLVDGRAPAETDLRLLFPAILALWDTGVDKVAGAWLIERRLDAASMVAFGFLVPLGWEDLDLIEDDGLSPQQDVEVNAGPEGVELISVDKLAMAGVHPDSYRLYRVRHEWVAQYLKSNVARQFGSTVVDVITPNLLALGILEIDGKDVPVYIARRLFDERSYAEIDTSLRVRSDQGTGLVLNAGRRVGFSIAENVLVSLADLLAALVAGEDEGPVIDLGALVLAFLRHRSLAYGGDTVELLRTGEHVATLCIPKRGTIDIDGENRILVIERLVAAYKKTGRPLKTEDMTQGMRDQSLANIFGSELWTKLKASFLHSPKRGYWVIAP